MSENEFDLPTGNIHSDKHSYAKKRQRIVNIVLISLTFTICSIIGYKFFSKKKFSSKSAIVLLPDPESPNNQITNPFCPLSLLGIISTSISILLIQCSENIIHLEIN